MPVSLLNLVITASVVLFILLIYRQLDKSNRSLEKVRRYADMVRSKLSDFVEEKTAEIRDLSIELQVNLKTGKEILKRVQGIEADLSRKVEGISGAQVQVEEYQASLENLSDMSARVDENLSRIHEESKFVDGLGKRIKTATDQIVGLEKRIPRVVEETTLLNQKHLTDAAERIRSGTEKKVLEIAATVEQADARVKDFSAYIARLESRKEQMEKNLFDDLEKLADQVSIKSRETHSKLVVELNGQIGAMMDAAAERRDALEISLTEMLRRAEEHRGSFETRLTDSLNQFDLDLGTVEGSYKQSLESAASRGIELEHEAFLQVRQKIAERGRQLEQEILGASKELEGRQATVHKELVDLYGKIRSELKVWDAETSQHLKEKDKILDQELDQLGSDLRRRGEEIETQLADVQSGLERIEGESAKGSLRLEEYRDTFLEKLDLATEELENSIAERAEKRLRDFETDVAYKFDKLTSVSVDIEDLEGNLRKVMENLSVRLRRDFDGYIGALEERRGAERLKTEEVMGRIQEEMTTLEHGLDDLKAKAYQDVSEKLKGFEDEFLADLKIRGRGMEESLQSWRQTVERQMSQISEEHVSARKQIEEDYREGLTSRIEQIKAINVQRFAQIDEEMESQVTSLQRELEEEKRSLTDRVEQVRTTLETWQVEIDERSEADKAQMRDELAEIALRVDELHGQLEEKANFTLDSFQRRHDEMESEFRIRSQDLRDDIADQVKAFRNVDVDIRQKVEDAQTRLLSKIDKEYAEVSQRLGQVERAQREYLSQTKLLEKADTYKLELEQDIDELKKELLALEPNRKELASIEGEFRGTRKLVEEASTRISRFMADRRRVDNLEHDFNRLIGISKSIDVRLATVTAASDAIDEIQVKLKEFDGLQEDVEGRYERLEKRQNILEATTKGVQDNFRQLQDLDDQTTRIRDELHSLPAELEAVRSAIERLSEDKERADKAVDQLEHLGATLADIESRMDDLTTAREWLAKTETRLQAIGQEAKDHVKLLKTLVKPDAASKGRGAPPSDTRQTVVKLANQGWSAIEIARATQISLGEVELILEVAG